MNTIVNTIKQRLSLREPLAEALDTTAQLVDKLSLKSPLPMKSQTKLSLRRS